MEEKPAITVQDRDILCDAEECKVSADYLDVLANSLQYDFEVRMNIRIAQKHMERAAELLEILGKQVEEKPAITIENISGPLSALPRSADGSLCLPRYFWPARIPL